MKKILLLALLTLTQSILAVCPVSNPGNTKYSYYEYPKTAAGFNSFLMDLALTMNKYSAFQKTTPAIPATLLDAFTTYLVFSDYSEIVENNCSDDATAYIAVYRPSNTDCAQGDREVDVMFSIKGFKQDPGYTGSYCQGAQGNWFYSFKIPSTDLIPSHILSKI